MKYLFGPVNSRRLGISLGIDLVPFKTCTLNCVYCECGKTTNLTAQRREYVPTDEVIRELDEYLSERPRLDVLTFSGSGEPTLHSGIGRVIDHIRDTYPEYRVVVLTNGTLLWQDDVRRDLLRTHAVMPSMDAVSSSVFNKMLRPADGIEPEKVIEGLVSFRREYRGEILLEIFLVPGLNDTEEELANIRQACLRIEPDIIQLNRLDRPGTEQWVKEESASEINRVKEYLKPLKVEVIGKPLPGNYSDPRNADLVETIMSTLKRRPSTLEDLNQTTGVRRTELVKIISALVDKGSIVPEEGERGEFYRLP